MSTANTKGPNTSKKHKAKRKPVKPNKPAPKIKKSVPAVKPAPPAVKKKPPGRKPGDKRRLEVKGAKEDQEIKARKAFDLRCDGWTIRAIAGHLGCSPSHVHDCIEKVRSELRAESLDLAAQEREMMLQQIDEAISYVIPHIRGGDIDIRTVKEGKRGPITITVEEYEARMKACGTLSRLVERKARMLGADAPLKVEGLPTAPAAPPEVSLDKAKDVLKRWGVSFAPKGITGAKVDE